VGPGTYERHELLFLRSRPRDGSVGCCLEFCRLFSLALLFELKYCFGPLIGSSRMRITAVPSSGNRTNAVEGLCRCGSRLPKRIAACAVVG